MVGADRNTDGLAPDSPGFMVLEPGTTLRNGRYRLINRLGSGGMAAVWLAEDELLGRKVAVKLMSEVIAEEPAWLERFRREARVAAALSHPNLVDVYDFEPDAPRPYLVMAHVPAGTLAQRLEKDDVPEPRRLASELLAALAHMHANGVMHRDVKPSNVMLGADGAARLGDYGISRPRDAPAVTATGQVLGSARYMAPEVMSGEPSDERSDIYSCGVVLEEVLTGRPDPELAPLVERMTRDEPTERPDSARTLRRELERFEPSQPSVSDRTAPTRPLGAAGPAAAGGVAAGAAAGGLAAAGATGGLAAEEAERPLASDPQASVDLADQAAVGPAQGPDPEADYDNPTDGEATADPDPTPVPGEHDRHQPAHEPTAATAREPVAAASPRPEPAPAHRPRPFEPPPQLHSSGPSGGRVLAALGVVAAVAVIAVVAILIAGGGSEEGDPSAGSDSQAQTDSSGSDGSGSGSGGGGGSSGSGSGSAPDVGANVSSGAPTAVPQPTASDPAGAVSLNDQGKAFIDAGKYAKAVPLLRQAVAASDPDSGDLTYAYALFNLGNALRLNGEPEAAIPVLRERLTIPDQTETVQAELDLAEAEAGQ